MGASDPGFETGFPKPSLDNPILFGQYADAIAACLRLQYGPSAGYRIAIERHDKDPKKRRWEINVHRGLFDGAQITIKPTTAMPHRAMVEVGWHSRMVDILLKGFVILSLPIFAVIFLALVFSTRIGFAVILTAMLFFIWAAIGAVLILIFAKICAKIAGSQFDYNRRATMAQEIKGFPLPSPATPPPPRP
jgi:hypothetical protein